MDEDVRGVRLNVLSTPAAPEPAPLDTAVSEPLAIQTRGLLLGLAFVAVLHLGIEMRSGDPGVGVFLMALVTVISTIALLMMRRYGTFPGAVHLGCTGLLLAACELQLHQSDGGALGVAWFALVPLVAGSMRSFRAAAIWASFSLMAWAACLKILAGGLPLEFPLHEPTGTLAMIERALPFVAALMLVYGQAARLAGLNAKVRDMERLAAAARREARTTKRRLREEQKLRGGILSTLEQSQRTPLTGMYGLSGLLLQTRLDVEQRSMVEDIRVAATTLRSGLDQLSDLARLASGELQMEHKRFDLHDVLAEAAQPWVEPAESRETEIMVRVHPETPRFLLGDQSRICRALSYLIQRAVAKTEDGEVTIDVLPIAVDGGRAALRFMVEDGDRNMSPEAQAAIFDAMLRGDATEALDSDPQQAGMALCRGMAEALDGETGFRAADSERGTRLWMTLPMPAAPDTHGQGLFAADFKGQRALIVHAKEHARRQIADLMRAMGISAVEADSCPEALNMLELASDGARPFHIALVDERTLNGDARAFRETIEQRPALASTCLVLLTADADSGQRFLDAGIPAYLAKPVLPSALKDTVALAVGLREQAEQQSA